MTTSDEEITKTTIGENRGKTLPRPSCKSDAHLRETIEAFLLSRRVGNCTGRTLGFYHDTLARFAAFEDAKLSCDGLTIQRYLTSLQERMKPVDGEGPEHDKSNGHPCWEEDRRQTEISD